MSIASSKCMIPSNKLSPKISLIPALEYVDPAHVRPALTPALVGYRLLLDVPHGVCFSLPASVSLVPCRHAIHIYTYQPCHERAKIKVFGWVRGDAMVDENSNAKRGYIYCSSCPGTCECRSSVFKDTTFFLFRSFFQCSKKRRC